MHVGTLPGRGDPRVRHQAIHVVCVTKNWLVTPPPLSLSLCAFQQRYQLGCTVDVQGCVARGDRE
jgi:hypothetical protein